MPDRILAPIMIGITGKREMRGKDDAVRSAIDACFDLLDRHLAASSKLLLTGLASGADTIAAQSALDRGWKVIAVLPFGLDLYAKDFDAVGAQQLHAFADEKSGLLSDPAKGRVIVLDPLIDPETKKPFPAARLSHRAEGSNPDRTDHYEQVGLFIADCSALMIAVMPATEQPDRIGGTARIVKYRLHGTHDAESGRIRRQSQILRKLPELDVPQTAPLWLIDLESIDDKSENALNSVQVWEPGTVQIEAIKKIKWTSENDLIHRLRLACRINAFNDLTKTIDDDQWQKEIEARARKDEQWKAEVDERKRPDTGDATSGLRRIRLALSIIQGQTKRRLTQTIKALTVFFVLAVMMVEIHLLSESRYTISLYVALLVVIAVVFYFAKSRILQQYSEDYRAVAEALRVQIAWWDAGLIKLDHRVDRTYLCGAAGSLGIVRMAIRHLIEAALLEKSAPRPVPDNVREWVTNQVKYFRTRNVERRVLLTRFEHAIWFLFVASMGMAFSLILLALMLEKDHWINPIVKPIDEFLMRPGAHWWLAVYVPAIAAVAMFAVALRLGQLSRTHYYREQRRMFERLNNFMGFVAGIFMTVGIYALVAGANPLEDAFSHVTHHMSACSGTDYDAIIRCSHNLAHNLALSVMVILASMAGALRFYSERLALEPELHSYREALEVFRRAENELFSDKSTVKPAQRENILLELGMSALKENESWIRAHRVRPLEPHV